MKKVHNELYTLFELKQVYYGHNILQGFEGFKKDIT